MMTMRKRVLPLGMAIFLLLTALFPVWAIAEGEATPAEVPMESVSPYRIILTAPGGWTSGNGAVMKVSITDKDRLGWQKIEYRMNDGNWVDCENLFADGRAELTFHENGTFTLRVTWSCVRGKRGREVHRPDSAGADRVHQRHDPSGRCQG